ncbi:MAG: cytochrome C [Deltaproteobacteria bacterium RBG_16_47_11]|nr:MAG: cytochrome C [Deltaproteobacteria bacterium RBG_16_47_11]
MKRFFISEIVLVGLFSLFLTNLAFAQKPNFCVDCHQRSNPILVKQYLESPMGKAEIECSQCHGAEHRNATDYKKVKMPNADTCKSCHAKQAEQFKAGKHSLAWVALTAMPFTARQPKEIIEKGCAGCHRVGYDGGKCDSCHTRHAFSREEAMKPEACHTCHMGEDHSQWEMWSTSKHGAIYKLEGETGRAPKCQTCHMPNGNHAVMTSWGFLALRLPEKDVAWMANRTEILKALGILDLKGKPTPRFETVKAGKLARLTAEEWSAKREEMIRICTECHSKNYVTNHFHMADSVIRDADNLMAEAIRIVGGLYRDGFLKKPKDYPLLFPDLLAFYDAPTTIEQTLYRMFLFHRQKTYQGAMHVNPDYMHWYGWAEMKSDLVKIKERAEEIRAKRK